MQITIPMRVALLFSVAAVAALAADAGEEEGTCSEEQLTKEYVDDKAKAAGLVDALQCRFGMEAEEKRNKGDIEGAKKLLLAGIRSKDSHDMRNNLATLLLDQGNLAEADVHLGHALRLNPASAQTYNNMGNLQASQNKEDSAIKSYKKSLLLDPTQDSVHYNLAALHLKHRRFGDGMKGLESVLKLNPAMAVAHKDMGDTLNEIQKESRAQEYYAKALSLEPDAKWAAAANNDYGTIMAKRGKIPEAKILFQRALELDESFTPARENLEMAMERLR